MHAEMVRIWPGAAARPQRLYLPTVAELLRAYAWRIGGESVPDPGVQDEGSAEVRELLADTLFAAPWRAETEYEFRCLLTKVQVGDGLWSTFKMGAPFDAYVSDDGAQLYTEAQAADLGRMFEEAHGSLGPLRMYEVAMGLARVLILPS